MKYINKKAYLDIISQILKDDLYNHWLKLVDEDGTDFANSNETNAMVALNHGLRHVSIVAENTAKLLYQYGSDERIIFLGYIAGLLHDVGIADGGKDDHARKSYNLISLYLNKFTIFTNNDKQLILNAILNHGNGDNITSPIDAFIAISDKLDFCRDRRVKSRYNSNSKIDEIISIDFNIKDSKLLIECTTTNDFDSSAFYATPKSIDIPIKVGWVMELNVEFYINGIKEGFEDRINYKGYVYGKN